MANCILLELILSVLMVFVVTDPFLVEDGLTGDVLNRPRTLFAADLAGVNLVRGRYSGEAVVTGTGLPVAGQAAPSVTLAKGIGASATFSDLQPHPQRHPFHPRGGPAPPLSVYP